ncbi:50S ribosomal protein L4 [Candidatus Daviesbacteria bacterium RIFCSPHIGHO2_02_FULL_39_12]|uniref:Large ribosomal subunit protein uL4 n=2 Tax=Candidatus Daviesiibacteriota TaxID=1752718 RepID=A0A1F5J9R8_9BACT|nr:MAG: 50S ribosomal protein L4 [Candidatus Daviesbacteria bacterium RIFCSPHIGHO2_02_FULL_39_12]OGE72657.1 MAG: 50S ribosomal protein L4 [Candidatus Daviesbacteria bacterium RIFCSPLOWO2_02_FULL_38_15]
MLSVPIYSIAGREAGTMSLPKELFGQKINKQLLSQAIRVYTTNKQSLLASTKTRGEVEGSTVKIWRQKGTGRARHGSVRAPIFVGGGIVFGPQSRKVRLTLSKKMKKAALLAALSAKAADKAVIGLTGIDKASGKTKEITQLLTQLNSKSSSALIITGEKSDTIIRAVRNIPNVNTFPMSLLNAYEILRHELLIVTKEAIEKL